MSLKARCLRRTVSEASRIMSGIGTFQRESSDRMPSLPKRQPSFHDDEDSLPGDPAVVSKDLSKTSKEKKKDKSSSKEKKKERSGLRKSKSTRNIKASSAESLVGSKEDKVSSRTTSSSSSQKKSSSKRPGLGRKQASQPDLKGMLFKGKKTALFEAMDAGAAATTTSSTSQKKSISKRPGLGRKQASQPDLKRPLKLKTSETALFDSIAATAVASESFDPSALFQQSIAIRQQAFAASSPTALEPETNHLSATTSKTESKRPSLRPGLGRKQASQPCLFKPSLRTRSATFSSSTGTMMNNTSNEDKRRKRPTLGLKQRSQTSLFEIIADTRISEKQEQKQQQQSSSKKTSSHRRSNLQHHVRPTSLFQETAEESIENVHFPKIKCETSTLEESETSRSSSTNGIQVACL